MTSEVDHVEPPQDSEYYGFEDVFRTGLTPEQVEWLYSYIFAGSLRRAEKESGINRRRHHEWIRNQLYRECFEAAQRHTAIAVEEEIRRRAIDGVVEPVFGKDGRVGWRRRYSDALLIKLAEASNPEKWKVTEKKPDNNEVRVNVYIPDNRRERVPVEGEPETIKMPKREDKKDG
jgi:hypothetical protein